METPDPLAQLEDYDSYCRLFTDIALWAPYVRRACRRHGLMPCDEVRPTLPGTCPTFTVEGRWVVKFFGRLFEGARAFAAEREANRLAAGLLPGPAVVASGELRDCAAGWPWPYLIFEYVPGVSIGEVWAGVSPADRLTLARQLGEGTRRLHSISLAGSPVFPASWEPYAALLAEQRALCRHNHEDWRSLPAPLIDQLDSFLLPTAELIDPAAAPHLIHADLTRDHILGRLEGERWQTLALIDWGDAMVGNLLYELAALHLDLLHGDRRLLHAYLDAYGLDAEARRRLPRRAMTVALLHRFNVLVGVLEARPELRGAASLGELADLLWSTPA